MKQSDIFSRRYFHPLICDLAPYLDSRRADALSRARAASEQVLCLPIYPALSDNDIDRVISCILEAAQ
jgi:dTDP-4-amino-4,6-dideoxygalactose transaminase